MVKRRKISHNVTHTIHKLLSIVDDYREPPVGLEASTCTSCVHGPGLCTG